MFLRALIACFVNLKRCMVGFKIVTSVGMSCHPLYQIN